MLLIRFVWTAAERLQPCEKAASTGVDKQPISRSRRRVQLQLQPPLALFGFFQPRAPAGDESDARRRAVDVEAQRRLCTNGLCRRGAAANYKLCEPHCAPSNVNASSKIAQYCWSSAAAVSASDNTPRKHQSRRPALTAAPITAARNPGVLKAA